MIIHPQTFITEESFKRWKNVIRMQVKDTETDEEIWCYIIPLMPVTKGKIQDELQYVPGILSSNSDEFEDEFGNTLYTMRLFDADMPEIETEEEVEILYKILTRRDLI